MAKIFTLVLTVVVSLLFSLKGYAQENKESKESEKQSINWMTFEEAVKKNKKKPRKIFIDVYTDWCGWCKKMDRETFLDPSVVDYVNKHYYAVKLNAEQKEPIKFKGQDFFSTDPAKPKSVHQLAIALLKQEMRYPSYVILDDETEWLFKLKGYKTPEDLLPVLRYYGSNQYKVMSWSEFNELKSL